MTTPFVDDDVEAQRPRETQNIIGSGARITLLPEKSELLAQLLSARESKNPPGVAPRLPDAKSGDAPAR